jgi:FkbM family methyltransferase
MKFFYGVPSMYVDVTAKVKNHCVVGDQVILPVTDGDRAAIFGDHIVGTLKHVKLTDANRDTIVAAGVKWKKPVNRIDWDLQPWMRPETDTVRHWYHTQGHLIVNPQQRLAEIHKRLAFRYGSMQEELPEQEMAMRFVRPENVVLELGANIGRNTCVIATILKDDTQLVTLETMADSVQKLQENRDLNGFHFQIEPSALSKQSLIQTGWSTEVSDVVKEGYVKVNTITWAQLLQKYKIPFDTLVADCEGALYHILRDEPDMLLQFKTVIVENDYWKLEEYQTVHNILQLYGFKVAYTRSGGWGPCESCFFQVFTKE